MRCRRRPGRCSASWARRPANSPRTPLAMDHPLAGAPLCRLAEISDGEGRGFILGTGAEQVALFVVRDGDHAFAYVNACPHQGTPLERSEEHTSELQSLMRISYAVFCLKKTKQ